MDLLTLAPSPSWSKDDDGHWSTRTLNEIFRLLIYAQLLLRHSATMLRQSIVSVRRSRLLSHKLLQLLLLIGMRDIPTAMANTLADDSRDAVSKHCDVETMEHCEYKSCL